MKNMPEASALNVWRVGTICASERSLEDYGLALGLNRQDLQGTILDLGSGLLQTVNVDIPVVCRDIGIEVPTVVSISPDMASQAHRKTLSSSGGFEQRTVAGIGQALPFKDDVFDRIFSLGALTMYAGFETKTPMQKEVVTGWMEEIIRTLKPGGKARLGGVYDLAVHDDYYQAFSTINASDSQMVVEPVMLPSGKPLIVENGNDDHMHRIVITKTTRNY